MRIIHIDTVTGQTTLDIKVEHLYKRMHTNTQITAHIHSYLGPLQVSCHIWHIVRRKPISVGPDNWLGNCDRKWHWKESHDRHFHYGCCLYWLKIISFIQGNRIHSNVKNSTGILLTTNLLNQHMKQNGMRKKIITFLGKYGSIYIYCNIKLVEVLFYNPFN